MNFFKIQIIFIIFFVLFINKAFAEDNPSRYKINVNKFDKSFEVEYSFNNKDLSDTQEVFIPEWVEGNFSKTHFEDNISDIKVFNEKNENLAITKIKFNTWEIKSKSSKYINIKYKVKSQNIPIVIGNQINKDNYFFNPASICLITKELQKDPIQIKLLSLDNNDKILTNLNKIEDFYYSPSYLDLIDSPFVVGKFLNIHFEQDNNHFNIAFPNQNESKDFSEIVNNIKRITKFQLDLFKDSLKKDYNFIIFLSNNSDRNMNKVGGMEHLFSSVIVIPENLIKEDSIYLLDLVAHEFFHHWNAKIIKSEENNNIDLTKPYNVTNLWFLEGVTNYYSQITLLKTGLINKEEYYEQLSRKYNYLVNHINKNNLSFDTNFVINDKNEDISQLYIKGEFLAMFLDIEVRDLSKNKYSLDDVLISLLEINTFSYKNLNDILFKMLKNAKITISDDFKTNIGNILKKDGLIIETNNKNFGELFTIKEGSI